MVSLSRSNMVTTLAVFVLLLACSICSGVVAASGAYILLEDGAGNATYPCRGIGGECLSDAEELEFMEAQFSQYYSSSNWRLMPGHNPDGQSHTGNTNNPGQPACGVMPGGQYKCCMNGGHTSSNYKPC